MKRRKYIWWAGLSCGFLLLVFLLRKPVLLHVSDGSCACADEEITGFIVLNPIRDRSPEKSAEFFLADLRSGKCSAGDSICINALKNHRISNWQLKNRDDSHGSVELYYRVAEYVPANPHYTKSGEGIIDLVQKDGRWAVTNYSSVF